MSEVIMPQLGETVTEGTITKWFKKVGDRVERDELLFEVSTDKVDSEVMAPAAGIITEIRAQEGDTVDVGTVLATIGDTAASPSTTPTETAPAVAEIETAPPPPPPAPPAAPVQGVSAPTTAAEPAPPLAPPVFAAAPAAASATGTDKVLSPVVRKLINEHGLDPALIVGTGAGGRITREDVLDVIDRNGAGAIVPPSPVAPPVAVVAPPAAAATPAPAQVVASSPASTSVAPVVPGPALASRSSGLPAIALSGRDEVLPFTNIRRKTGEHMLMSLATAPHAFIAAEIDFSGVDRTRIKAKDAFKAEEGFSLTYLPFIARAVVEAMVRYPNVNASVSGDSLVIHRSVHLGIAVDLDFNGLMVPVIRDADGKRMRAIARNIADVASRARTKKLVPDDLTGGTFTISNAGPYGIDLMSSIINQPQVAIMSTTAVKKKPVVVELPDGSDSIAIHPMGFIGLSWDHRAFDGAYAASFLAEVRTILETRDWSSEL